MSSNELFDIYNERMEHLGTAARKVVHTEGYWHQTFHCWIAAPSADGEWRLLLQLRHKDKVTYPGMLDISSAGHLLAGETPSDGVRELQEELGIHVSAEELSYCGVVAEENIVPGRWIDREFNHIFIYVCSLPLSGYTFQRSEISGLFFVGLESFTQLVAGDKAAIPAEGLVAEDGGEGEREGEAASLLTVTRDIGMEDIAPNSDRYYKLLFERLRELTGAS